jgi:glucokinase
MAFDGPRAARASLDSEARHAAHLRGLNLERILGVAMTRPGPFTRTEIIDATGLSAPTVGSLTSHLIDNGLLRDLGTGPSSGGRRPSFMEFNARHGFVLGIDLGPTRTRLAVADLRGDCLGQRVLLTPRGVGPASLLAKVAAAVKSLLREARVPLDGLLAIGAGAPGAVDHDKGVVVTLAPNLKGWSKVPMAAMLQRSLGAPVIVENDVNLAVLGEHWRGAARGHDTCAFVMAGTGIGAGILIGGELHRGHHFLAGEVALMCMGPEYVNVNFGAQGCLEALASLKALAARWSDASRNGGQKGIGGLFEAVHAGDRRARKIVDEAATLVGIATANLSVVIDPSLIVLGGALFAQSKTLVDEVRRIVGRIVPTPSEVVMSALGEEASLWGSLLVATTEARNRIRQALREVRVTA